jgi:hypothetical protein
MSVLSVALWRVPCKVYEFSSICRSYVYNVEECQLINQAVQTTIHGKNIVITSNNRLKLHSNTPNYDVLTYVICLQTQYIKSRA